MAFDYKNKTVTLNNGVEMPVIGFGVFQIPDLKECERCVCDAIDVGYRAIDTASHYFNETAVGNAIKRSKVAREDLFITTKFMCGDAGYERTLQAFELSMDKLQLDYLDLYLIHHPYGDIYGSWRAMEELYKAGRVRAIGLCNVEPFRYVDMAINNAVKPAVVQTETHPFFHQKKLKECLKEFNTQLIAAEGMAQGHNGLFTDPVLTTIGAKYGKTAAQVINRWHLQREDIIIPKSIHRNRMEENFNIFDFQLSDEDMGVFESMDTGAGIFCDRQDPERVKTFCRLSSLDD